ncbi:aminomethyl-transferring glycine dehydrogenase subunit GcvPA [Candidatus Halobeggiatoa sp. HSG11]|nr:aminomethyl-transferring glycine dehydrogenase subunit GcvPA [Candidatus Halobeggiatoa sp. HSG11]
MYGYNTLNNNDKKLMLKEIGLETINSLFQDIPEPIRMIRQLNLPQPYSEWALEKKLVNLAKNNIHTDEYFCFLGGGYYNHFVPAVVDAIVNRSEFLTSYTPYQPEMSQGLLQALYEYQLLMAKITGLPIVSSSSYDGATALADAALMCDSIQKENKNQKLLVAKSIWPQYLEVLKTYMSGRKIEIEMIDYDIKTGMLNFDELRNQIQQENPVGFLFQSPNAFGIIEDIAKVTNICNNAKVISVLSFNPLTIGLLKTPGELGVDIVTGEGQPLGIHLNAGGSSLGILSTHSKYRQYIPGRLIGKVKDIKGNPAYSLVFENREQHVAREKANTNICSNQALNSIKSAIFLSYVGETGFRKLAMLNYEKTQYLMNNLLKLKDVELVFNGMVFNEFVIKFPISVKIIIEKMLSKKIFAGIEYKNISEIENTLLISVTEKLDKGDLDYYISSLKEILA